MFFCCSQVLPSDRSCAPSSGRLLLCTVTGGLAWPASLAIVLEISAPWLRPGLSWPLGLASQMSGGDPNSWKHREQVFLALYSPRAFQKSLDIPAHHSGTQAVSPSGLSPAWGTLLKGSGSRVGVTMNSLYRMGETGKHSPAHRNGMLGSPLRVLSLCSGSLRFKPLHYRNPTQGGL